MQTKRNSPYRESILGSSITCLPGSNSKSIDKENNYKLKKSTLVTYKKTYEGSNILNNEKETIQPNLLFSSMKRCASGTLFNSAIEFSPNICEPPAIL